MRVEVRGSRGKEALRCSEFTQCCGRNPESLGLTSRQPQWDEDLDSESRQRCRRFLKPAKVLYGWLTAQFSLANVAGSNLLPLPTGAGSGSLSILASHLSPVLYRGQFQGHPNNPHKILKYVRKGEVEESISAFLQVLRVLTSFFFGETTTCRQPEKTIQLEREAGSAFGFLGLTRTT